MTCEHDSAYSLIVLPSELLETCCQPSVKLRVRRYLANKVSLTVRDSMAEHVWLGLAGDLVSDPNAVDFYTTKVGGAPVYPGEALPEAAASQLHCSLCSSQLSLVLQAYAPCPTLAARVILAFGCTKLGCGKSSECWKAFRCQQQQQQQHESSDKSREQQPSESTASELQQQRQPDQQLPPPAAAPAPAPATADVCSANSDWGAASDWSNPAAAATPAAAAADPWAAAGSSDFATDESTVTTLSACNAFDFSDLTSSLEAAAQQAAAAAAAAKPKSRSVVEKTAAAAAEDLAAAAAAAVCCRGSAGPELPEFYLYAESEPGESAAKAINNEELQHVQQLLQEYEAQEAGAATTSSSSRSAAHVASSSNPAAAASGVDSEDNTSWAGESYEKEEIRGVDRGYLKFSKRLQRRPEQCARYCLGGQVLWPKAPPKPSPCSRCGGPRLFELQLMPALIPMVIEAGQMRQEQQLPVDHQVVDAVANWEWCTVAVFTCQASCSTRSSEVSGAVSDASDSTAMTQCDFCVEEIVMINEQECHTALPAPHAGPPTAGEASTGAAAEADDNAESEGDTRSRDEHETCTN